MTLPPSISSQRLGSLLTGATGYREEWSLFDVIRYWLMMGNGMRPEEASEHVGVVLDRLAKQINGGDDTG